MLSALFQAWARPPTETSETCIRRILPQLGGGISEVSPGLWQATFPPRDTYRVILFMWAVAHRVHCQAVCGICVERDWVPRELALVLLEENGRIDEGAFQLVARGNDRVVALAGQYDMRYLPEHELSQSGQALVDQLQRVVQRITAMGLVVDGPHAH